MICDSMDNVDGTSGPDGGLRKSTHFYNLKGRSTFESFLSMSSSAIIVGHTPKEDRQSISISLCPTICGNKYFVVTKSDIVKSTKDN